ncbi:MAG: phosphate--acyl-ACP acyltransferase, partial [Clostridia bacterium]|nr:phosphate--acyl-ACP acyltransferase [Clostridia bacterium]
MTKILVDTLGGDNGAPAVVEGAVRALKEIDDLELILVGDEGNIKELLTAIGYNGDRITVEHAPDVIDCNEKPTEAIRVKKESSLRRCIDLLKKADDIGGMVSVGSTGALLAGAVLLLGR